MSFKSIIDEICSPKGEGLNLGIEIKYCAPRIYMALFKRKMNSETLVLNNEVHPVTAEIDQQVATMKLVAMGISIDSLTPEQMAY